MNGPDASRTCLMLICRVPFPFPGREMEILGFKEQVVGLEFPNFWISRDRLQHQSDQQLELQLKYLVNIV